MPEIRSLSHVDTMSLPVTQPFNFRYTLWKPSHFATGLERHSQDQSWRTFRVGELVCGVILELDRHDAVRAEVARTTQMMTNLLDHYDLTAEFDGVRLKAFFTPEEIASVDEATFRERDRLGYRAKYIGRFAEFFTAHDPDEMDHGSKTELMTEFQTIKGVGPCTAAVIAGHAVRDPSALGLDVWNRKLLARQFLDVEDAAAEVVMAEMTRLFPGYEGLAGLYVIEDAYRERAVVELV